MFFIISKILAFTIKPSSWILLLLIIAVFNKNKRKHYLIYSLFTFYFFSNDFIFNEVIKIWEEPQTAISSLTKKYEAGILLGGFSEYDYLTKRHNFKKEADRLIYTVQLYNTGIIKKIVISGGNGMIINNKYKEAETIKQFLLQNNIDEKNIIIESKSRNTKENALETVKILDAKNEYILITSAIHMKRSQLCFKNAGLKTIPFPVDNSMTYRSKNLEYILLPRARTLERWEELIHEIIGYYVYKIS
tara:strand:- start:4851 stop:5591 length:741 start_codon:yes stop_codon:yes gene_type:complete